MATEKALARISDYVSEQDLKRILGDSFMTNLPKVTVPHRIGVVRATRAENDEELLQSWLKSLSSPHTRRNFETTARRLLAELSMGLRAATVEDVRDARAEVGTPAVGFRQGTPPRDALSTNDGRLRSPLPT
jgi:hypothetical protein